MTLRRRLVERIHRQGPVPFDAYVEAALYDPDDGFFSKGRGAGRSGRDFVTGPEVGPLFGALVARYLDDAWAALGEPDPFVVVEAGAGNGRLAREVLRAGPRCARALRLVLVERSRALREEQRERLDIEPVEDALGPSLPGVAGEAPTPVPRAGPIVTSLDELPAIALNGVVIANELLDNLPFRVVERAADGWQEVRVGVDDSGALVEVLVPAPAEVASAADESTTGVAVAHGARLPLATGATEWLSGCAAMLRRGYFVAIDYADDAPSMLARGPSKWLRTYRAHERGTDPLHEPGEQDITYDMPVEQLRGAAQRFGLHPVLETSQGEWLRSLGLDDLVAGARDAWRERAHVGDLDAVAARSRVGEAAALTDVDGLGAHRVFMFAKGRRVPVPGPAGRRHPDG
jgi:SAM-dependent MidA family methyltransferase